MTQIHTAIRLEVVMRDRGIHLAAIASGAWLVGQCPFHREHASRLLVDVQMQCFHCFGCGAAGNVVDFVAWFDRCSRQEAITGLANPTIPLATRYHEGGSERPGPQRSVFSDRTVQLLTQAQQCYQEQFWQSRQVWDDLERRGLSPELAMTLGLGYVGYRYLLTGKLDAEQHALAEVIGLLHPWGTDRLFGRITIPEYGSQGCHWLIGRQLPTSPPPRIARSARYLGLSLARPLLGYEHALTRLSEDLEAILVVEHALDWLYPLQWKLPVLPVSCVGPQVSSSQLASLLDLMQRAGQLPIVLGRDVDMTRRRASVRLQQQLWRRGARVGVLPLLEGVSSLGELGQRPDGRAILEQALRTALAQFPMQAPTHHQQQEGS